MKYIAYFRRSSEDSKKKQIQSIKEQKEWLEDFALEKGIEVIEKFEDSKTAKEPGREGFTKMMDFIHNHQGEDLGIVVWKVDRLSRNPIDEGAVKFALLTGKIKHILASDREFTQNDNQILMGIEFSEATQFIVTLRKNAVRGMNSKIRMGWMPSLAPQGYMNEKGAFKGSNRIFIDPKGERWNLLQKALKLILGGGHTPAEVRRKLNEEWGFRSRKGKTMSVSSFYAFLKNPFYAGYFPWEGELVKGAHEPMITLEEYDEIQLLLGKKGNRRMKKHESPYSGIIKCGECGYSIIAEAPKRVERKDGKVKILHYLRCSKRGATPCTQKYLEKDDFEDGVNAILQTLRIPLAFQEWALAELRKDLKVKSNDLARERSQIQKSYNDNEKMIESLLDKLLKGIITDAVYREHKTRFEVERGRLNGLLAEYDQSKNKSLSDVEEKFEFARTAVEKFNKGDYSTKRTILEGLGSKCLLKDQKLLVELDIYLDAIKNTDEFPICDPGAFELLDLPLCKAKTEVLNSQIPKWLPRG